jgi:hypothetical protein
MPYNSNLLITVTTSADTASVNVIGASNTGTIQYVLTYPDGTAIGQSTSTFVGLANGNYAILVLETDTQDNSVTTVSNAFSITGTAQGTTATFTVTASPEFVQAVYNPMPVSMTKTPYTIGDMFFVEVWVIPSKNAFTTNKPKTSPKLIQTLKGHGKGDGTCTININTILASQFIQSAHYKPNPYNPFQKDESAYLGYFIKAGSITYDRQNREVKVYEFESAVQYALRAALPLTTDGNMIEYIYMYDGEPVKYLTSLPNGSRKRRDEDVYLSVFLPLNTNNGNTDTYTITVKADLRFSSGAPQTGYEIGSYYLATGGVYIFNVKPQTLVANTNYNSLTSYSVYLEISNDATLQSNPCTNTKEIAVDSVIASPIAAQFMNRLGGWDALQLRKDTETDIKTDVSSFTPMYGSKVYQVNSKSATTYHSNWLTAIEYQWLKDMMLSPAVYIDNNYVSLKDESFKLDTMLGLFALDITVAPAYEENTIKL